MGKLQHASPLDECGSNLVSYPPQVKKMINRVYYFWKGFSYAIHNCGAVGHF